MRYAALLIGFYATTACSLEHVVVAELDIAGAGGSPLAPAGSAGSAGAGGSAGAVPSAGSGGSLFSGGSPAVGDAGGATFSVGGVDTHIVGTIIGEGGGGSEKRCSCIGKTSELCGTDGITYPSQCVDAGTCSVPGIACLQACPCPDGQTGNLPTTTSEWFPEECSSSAHCSEGVICMTFSGATFNDEPTPCN